MRWLPEYSFVPMPEKVTPPEAPPALLIAAEMLRSEAAVESWTV